MAEDAAILTRRTHVAVATWMTQPHLTSGWTGTTACGQDIGGGVVHQGDWDGHAGTFGRANAPQTTIYVPQHLRAQDEGRLNIHDYRVHALGDKKEKAKR
jgi:hypothetical protein